MAKVELNLAGFNWVSRVGP